jgi:hypothetical protein
MNNDGFLDVIAGNTLYINNGNNNNYVKFDLQGIMSNKDGVGARIEIHGSWGIQIREVRAGESFDPASSLIAHFGIGSAEAIEYAVIKWPSGMTSTLDAPAINTTHIVPEVGCMLPESVIYVEGATTICPGEEVLLTAQEGNSYTWNNGEESQSISVNEAGSYSVIIWDEEGCASLSNLVVISEVQEVNPTISLTGESVFCFGTSVVLSCDQGSGTWSNGQSGSSIVVTEGGDYSISVAGTCSGSEFESETISLVAMDAIEPVAEDVILSEPGVATLNATGNNLSWYATESSTEVLGNGNTFDTDLVTTSLTYWVEATDVFGGEVQMGGKPDNNGTGGLPASGGRLFFNITEPCTLAEVTAYLPAEGIAGMRTVQLYDGNGTLIDQASVNCEIGENILALGFELSSGDYQIGCAENNLFRNSGGVSFPYSIGTMGSINNTTNGTSYYYYFYNWQVQKPSFECTSDRIEVSATVVGVEELDSSFGIGLFPNPASEALNISVNGKFIPTNIEITNAEGRVVLKSKMNVSAGQNAILDVNTFAAGLYHVVLTDGNTIVSTDFIKK